MTAYTQLFLAVLVLVGIPLGILGLINRLRKKQPGCSGSHDCVVYKGEKVQCPSCELKEFQAEQKKKCCSTAH